MTATTASSFNHRVRRLSCDTIYQAFFKDDSFSSLKFEMDAFVKSSLPVLLDEVFSRYDTVEQVFYLKQLNINLPLTYSGDKNALKKQLLRQCESQLVGALSDLVKLKNQIEVEVRQPSKFIAESLDKSHNSKNDVEKEAVFFYLQYGFLGWKYHPYKQSLSSILSQVLHKKESLEDIKVLIKRTPKILPRLMHILDKQQDAKIYSWIFPEQSSELFTFWGDVGEKLQDDMDNNQVIITESTNIDLSSLLTTIGPDINIHAVMRQVMLSGFFSLEHKRLTSSQVLGRLIGMLADALNVEQSQMWQWMNYRFVSPSQKLADERLDDKLISFNAVADKKKLINESTTTNQTIKRKTTSQQKLNVEKKLDVEQKLDIEQKMFIEKK